MQKTIFLLCIFLTAFASHHIETERTIWRPWTVPDSEQWEQIEQSDTSITHFYRNDFLESMDELLVRDSHWLTLCSKIESSIGTLMHFPHLGFAITNKTNQELIGTVRMKLCTTPGHLSFGFGLRPDMRNQHFGREILSKLISMVNECIGSPIAQYKPGITKQDFMKEWYHQCKKKEPDFDHLMTFFHTQPYPFQTLIGSVDMMNPASLTVLLRNNMEPFSLEYDKYIIDETTSFFRVISF